MRKISLLILFVGMSLSVSSQNEDKFSASTRIFMMNYMHHEAADTLPPQSTLVRSVPDSTMQMRIDKEQIVRLKDKLRHVEGLPQKDETGGVAPPYKIRGVTMMQAFIKLTDTSYSELEALGVRIDAKIGTLITAMIPVDELDAVAALPNVVSIEAAQMVNPTTDKARKKTNVDDVLQWSSDAQNAGLLQEYDGTGVIIGIIDAGIQFDHQMFNDKNGNSRVIHRLIFDPSDGNFYIYPYSYWDYTTNHGTNTACIAGGSDYTFNYTTSSGNQGSVKLGGMAPGADLILFDLSKGGLIDTNLATAISIITQYADYYEKPCVINLSLGNHYGPHDGTGSLAECCNQLSGDGKIIVFAASNEANDNIYSYGNATKASPAKFALMNFYGEKTSDGSYAYNKKITGKMQFWARKSNVPLAVKIYAISFDGNIYWVSNEITSTTTIKPSTTDNRGVPFKSFFTETLNIDVSTKNEYNNKYCITIESKLENVTMWDTDVGKLGAFFLGIDVYPQNSTSNTSVDSWIYDGNSTFEQYTVSDGSKDHYFRGSFPWSTASNQAHIESVIPVGAYCSKPSVMLADGNYYPYGDSENSVASFSSWQAQGYGPDNKTIPWISAPGEWVQAAFNKGYLDYLSDLQSNNMDDESDLFSYGCDPDNPIGAMSGTSQAAPCVTGIIALWLQADPTLNYERVKDIIKNTAKKDSYTNANYSYTANGVTLSSNGKDPRFGNGKIDALAGLKSILDEMYKDLKRGDVNADSFVDLADAVCVVNHVVKKENPFFIQYVADVNGDGIVNIADAVSIVNIVVRKEEMAQKNQILEDME